MIDWLVSYYHHKQRSWSLRLSVSLNTSFTTSFATFFTMLLAAIYNTPAVPNQNSVSSGFILYQICLVLIILKAYTVYLGGCSIFTLGSIMGIFSFSLLQILVGSPNIVSRACTVYLVSCHNDHRILKD